MKKILAVLIAALMICLSVVPAMATGAASGGLSPLGLVQYAIKIFGETGARIHEAYADTIKKAMDERRYYNEQGLAKAYDKMQVSMRNTGASTSRSMLNTQYNQFYNTITNRYDRYENNIYYNKTYNSYYTQITNNDIDYNYFITFAPTYTNVTYIVDGCNDPSQAVSTNYYFQLPDGRNSYYLTADDVVGVSLVGSGRVINYDVVPESENCVALYHFDGNIVDASGRNNTAAFSDGTVPQYISSSGFGKHLMLSNRGRFTLTLPEALEAPYTIEFRLNYGQYQSFFPVSSELKLLNDIEAYLWDSRVTHSGSTSTYKNNEVFIKTLREYGVSHNYYSFYFSGVDAGTSSARFGYYWGTKTLLFYDFPSVTNYYAKDKSGNFVTISTSLLSSNYDTCFTEKKNMYSAEKLTGQSFNYGDYSSNSSIPIPLGQWVNMAIVNDGSTVKYYMNGVEFAPPSNWIRSSGNVNYLSFYGSPGFSYSFYDELRISKGALYTQNYTPATAPFDLPNVLVLPAVGDSDFGTIAIKSFIDVADCRIGGVRPSYPKQGDVYISLSAEKKVTSCQQYQSGSWVEVDGSIYYASEGFRWYPLDGFDMAVMVVGYADYSDFVDKKDDPEAGTNANPDAEATSLTVHHYKEGTTERVRQDTVYQNVAVGSSFTVNAPSVNGYKVLLSSAKVVVEKDGEHTFYYATDTDKPGGGGEGDNDPSKPGFFDGLLSSVKSLVNVICGFVGGVVQSLLSGLTGIISTLIDAFKAVLSLGGHFGDFLAAALGFVPREIIDLLIAGIAVTIALAIIRFIRG